MDTIDFKNSKQLALRMYMALLSIRRRALNASKRVPDARWLENAALPSVHSFRDSPIRRSRMLSPLPVRPEPKSSTAFTKASNGASGRDSAGV